MERLLDRWSGARLVLAHILVLLVFAGHLEASDLCDAVRSNDLARVKAILADDPDAVHGAIGNGATPLHVAAAADAADAAAALLAAGADVNARTSGGFTPLHWAANRGATATTRVLIAAGAEIDAKTKSGLTALHWAASKNALEVAKVLLAAGADSNALTLDGMTPLHWAVMKNAQDCADLLAFKQVSDEMDREPPAQPVVAPPPPPEVPSPGDALSSSNALPALPVIQTGQGTPFGRTLIVDIGFGEELTFVWLEPLHLWAGKFEITNGQFRRFRASHDSGSREKMSLNSNPQPVVNVSWYDATAFAAWVNHMYGESLPQDMCVRLPLSAEWQAIASCGKARIYPWGNEWPPKYGNFGDLSARRELTEWNGIRGYDDGFPVSCPVTRSGANEWGIFGMAGNVWEWCFDANDLSGRYKIRHGASWDFDQEPSMRIATQGFDRPEVRTDTIGFRLIAAPKM